MKQRRVSSVPNHKLSKNVALVKILSVGQWVMMPGSGGGTFLYVGAP